MLPLPRRPVCGVRMVCMLAPDQRRSWHRRAVISCAANQTRKSQLDEPGTVGPPEQAELLDRQKTKPPRGFFACSFRYGVCECASLV